MDKKVYVLVDNSAGKDPEAIRLMDEQELAEANQRAEDATSGNWWWQKYTPTPPQAQAQVAERNHEEDDWRITQAIRADKQGRSWHVGERESGSISVFYTRMEVNGHYVVYDTSESHPLSAPQQQADGRIAEAMELIDPHRSGGVSGTELTKAYALLAELDGPK